MTLPQPEPQAPEKPQKAVLLEPHAHDGNYTVARWMVLRIIWELDSLNPHATGASLWAIAKTAYHYGIASGWFAVHPETIPRTLQDAEADGIVIQRNGAYIITRKGADWFNENSHRVILGGET